MKKILEFIRQLFTDVNGKFSSKRFFGFCGVLAFGTAGIVCIFKSVFGSVPIDPEAADLIKWGLGFFIGLLSVVVVEKKLVKEE